jgi:hypothetical protein
MSELLRALPVAVTPTATDGDATYPISRRINMRKFVLAAGIAAALVSPSMASAKDTAPVAPAYTTDTVGSCDDTPGAAIGSIGINKGVATFNVPNASAYGVIKVPQTGLKVKDIKTLQFKSLSSMGGMVYMNVVTNDNHKIKYTPSAQTPEPGIGAWYTHNMLTSGVRLNDADDGTPAMTWANAVSQLGNETVNRVSVTAGCSIGFGTVQLDKLQVNNSTIDFK